MLHCMLLYAAAATHYSREWEGVVSLADPCFVFGRAVLRSDEGGFRNSFFFLSVYGLCVYIWEFQLCRFALANKRDET